MTESNTVNTRFPTKTFMLIFIPPVLVMITLLVITVWSIKNPEVMAPENPAEQGAPHP